MKSPLYLTMDEHVRQEFIRCNTFYLDQACRRLLDPFTDASITEEADRAAQACTDRFSQRFDPDRDDPADAFQYASDENITTWLQLNELRMNTRLSIAAGMFQAFEKSLREWLADQLARCDVRGSEGIWTMTFSGLLEQLSEPECWNMQSQPFRECLRQGLLLVNAWKHGNGPSFEKLVHDCPRFIDVDDRSRAAFGTNNRPLPAWWARRLTVELLDLKHFSDAISAFWAHIPEYTPSDRFSFLQKSKTKNQTQRQ